MTFDEAKKQLTADYTNAESLKLAAIKAKELWSDIMKLAPAKRSAAFTKLGKLETITFSLISAPEKNPEHLEIIAAAIRSAVAGDVYMTDEIRKIYETRKGVKGLSPREAEVIAVAAKGCGNREIGQRLGISENSVKIHLKRAYFKLGASDRAEAVTIAMQRGFIPGA